MSDVLHLLFERKLAVVVQAPEREVLIARALAAAQGGISILALPVSVPFVAEIAAEIADRANVPVGLADVMDAEHVSIALASGAEFVLSPVFDDELVKTCTDRGLAIVPSGATPTEVARARNVFKGPIAVHPAATLGGPAWLAYLGRLFPGVPLLASGAIGPDQAPHYLEMGAAAVIVDVGLFPTDMDPASDEVIAVRASALVEMCADAAPGLRASRP